MRWKSLSLGVAIGLGSLIAAPLSPNLAVFAQGDVPADPMPDDGTVEAGVEVLTRGPVHEAFANPVDSIDDKPVYIEKAPPAPIEELPPDEKPEGDNVAWIGGYWQWDDELKDYLWVAGVWRVIPPGQQWVAGYWRDTPDGWQWTEGFWLSLEREEVSYLPEPPEPIRESVGEAPSEDHFYVPGIWRYNEERYVWRPGYYTRMQPGWVWVAAHYVPAPGGVIYVDGYWDYPVTNRGVIFAPIYFREPVYREAGYAYTPSFAIDTGLLTVHLFARPRYHHYYFGDYYEPRYTELGFRPWFDVRSYSRYGYDPIFAYYRWQNGRRDRNWSVNLQRRFDYYRGNERFRPPRTLVDQRTYVRNNINNTTITNNIVNVNNNVLGVPLNRLVSRRDSDLRFERVNNDRRREYASRAASQREFAQQRSRTETAARRSDRGPRGAGERNVGAEAAAATRLPSLRLATPTPEARAAARRPAGAAAGAVNTADNAADAVRGRGTRGDDDGPRGRGRDNDRVRDNDRGRDNERGPVVGRDGTPGGRATALALTQDPSTTVLPDGSVPRRRNNPATSGANPGATDPGISGSPALSGPRFGDPADGAPGSRGSESARGRRNDTDDERRGPGGRRGDGRSPLTERVPGATGAAPGGSGAPSIAPGGAPGIGSGSPAVLGDGETPRRRNLPDAIRRGGAGEGTGGADAIRSPPGLPPSLTPRSSDPAGGRRSFDPSSRFRGNPGGNPGITPGAIPGGSPGVSPGGNPGGVTPRAPRETFMNPDRGAGPGGRSFGGNSDDGRQAAERAAREAARNAERAQRDVARDAARAAENAARSRPDFGGRGGGGRSAPAIAPQANPNPQPMARPQRPERGPGPQIGGGGGGGNPAAGGGGGRGGRGGRGGEEDKERRRR